MSLIMIKHGIRSRALAFTFGKTQFSINKWPTSYLPSRPATNYTRAGRAKLSHEDTARTNEGDISDFDLYNTLPPPVNNIDSVTSDGFILANGRQLSCLDTKNDPKALALIGTESFQLSLKGALKGLDSGVVEIDSSALGIFDVVYPKPEMLVVGLGNKKSRILGPRTSEYLRSLGVQLHVSNSEYAASNFDILATERPDQIGALILAPNL